MIARWSQTLFDDLASLVDAPGTAVESGQLKIAMVVARIGLDARKQRSGGLRDTIASDRLAGRNLAADVIAGLGRDVSRGRLLIAAASNRVVSGQVLHFAERFLIAGVGLTNQGPKLDGLHEVAALFQQP